MVVSEAMDFEVVPHKGRWSKETRNKVFLLTDGWDDWFKYSTMYIAFYIDEGGEEHRIGEVKIGQFGMLPDQRHPDIPDQFTA